MRKYIALFPIAIFIDGLLIGCAPVTTAPQYAVVCDDTVTPNCAPEQEVIVK